MASRVRLGGSGLYARDRDRLAAFYQTIFQLKLATSDEMQDLSELTLEWDGCVSRLSIVGKPIAVKTVFHTGSFQEAKEIWERIKTGKIPVRGLYVEREGISFEFSDPEGNQIKVLWPQDLHNYRSPESKELALWIQLNHKAYMKRMEVN